MATSYFYVGNKIRVSGAFTDTDGVAQDPTVVLFAFLNPSGTTTTYTYVTDAELVKDSTGNYHVDIDADTIGTWYVRFYATGTGQSASESCFVIDETEFD